MKMDTHIINFCLTCKNHMPENNSGMDVYCGQEKMMVNNYVAQKCYAKKLFISLPDLNKITADNK